MVTNPLDYVEPLGKGGASGFTFHVEASKDNWQVLVLQIRAKGMKPGVALKPSTPVEEVYPLVSMRPGVTLKPSSPVEEVYPLLDGDNPAEMVLVMTVEPGFGGQKFMPETMDKVRALRKKYPSLDIEFDEDRDGKISASELRRCLGSVSDGEQISEAEAKDVVLLMDSDGSGLLGLEDFERLMEETNKEEKERDLREAFKMYEMEGRVCIRPRSLKMMLSKIGKSKSVDECKLMIAKYDLDGDGVLNFDEFKKMMS
ncbi:ribulose-phosphate 3-epimerase [Sarracenia purpurea var. burkii]